MYIIKIEYATPAFDELSRLRYEEIMAPSGNDWDEELLSEEENKTHFAIYDVDFKLLGGLKLKMSDNLEKKAELEELVIVKNFRNKGLGTMLLNKASETLRQDGIENLYCAENEEYAAFLTKVGFEKTADALIKKLKF